MDVQDGTGDSAVAVDDVIAVALEEFAAYGYADTKLDTIASTSGMSKRMIHYHLGDKLGLYTRALNEAIRRLHVPKSELQLDTSVPVEGVRKLIDAMFDQFLTHPTCVRLLLKEGLDKVATGENQVSLSNDSETTLYLDRLLLLGQDSGAFRPGISAYDIYALISSLVFYRQIHQGLTHNLFDIDLASEEATRGLHRMIVDAVLAFLTANIPDSGQRAYLSSASDDDGADRVYED